ncbi:MAG TPA: hypothetical protein VEK15_28035 [Vicinamibacteria bacterium]|nr:hypothetical protein [Vicinamibacteria bacterium]
MVVALEVKSEKIRRASIPRSARSFIEAYGPRSFLVINRGLETRTRIGRTDVGWVLPTDVIQRIEEAFDPE